MKKILAVFAVILLSFSAAATTITSEDVTIDLSQDSVSVEVFVEELTSTDFSYISSHEIRSVNGSVNGEPVDCSLTESPIGSEIRCPTDLRTNFTVKLDYLITDAVEETSEVKMFRYDHPIYRPTEEYNLRVLLPEGNALVEEDNTTRQVISPLNYETGSNGRQIYVDWSITPELGDTLSFYILFENFSGQNGFDVDSRLPAAIAVFVLLLIAASAAVIHWRREDLSENLEDLTDDQKEIMEKIEENGGEYLQKDLVDEMDYSKAKISGEVSELVERGILNKTKDGRSNKLSISRKYRY